MERPISRRAALEVLGLPATASAADITSAFRRLARLSHPDATGRTDASAGQRFAALVEAYHLLAPANESPERDGSVESPAAPGSPEQPEQPERRPVDVRPPTRRERPPTVPGTRPPIVAGPVVVRPYPRDRGR
jgi:hypothetical protein